RSRPRRLEQIRWEDRPAADGGRVRAWIVRSARAGVARWTPRELRCRHSPGMERRREAAHRLHLQHRGRLKRLTGDENGARRAYRVGLVPNAAIETTAPACT